MKIRLILLFILVSGGIQVFAQDYSSKKSTETIQEGNQVFFIHTVEKGNTLYNISKTYAVPPNVIIQNNPLVNEGLSLGMKLKIPKVEKREEEFIYHIVKKKETLYQISKIYNVTVDDIIRINELEGKEISPGQYLKIPSLLINAEKNIKVSVVKKNTKVDNDKYMIYKVQPKETLFSISKRFGISTDALMYLNDLSSPNISTGQVLLIPKKLIQKEGAYAIDTEKYISHKVKAKETLYGIARIYAVSVNDIRKSNELGEAQIQVGQTLLIPRDLNKTGFIKHKVVERREKLAKIATEYDLSVSELKKANPHLPSKLKRGQSVLIPLGFIETDFDQEIALEENEAEEKDVILKEDNVIEFGCDKVDGQAKVYQVALMLPLYLNEVDTLLSMDQTDLLNNSKAKPFKFIEFYEGALMAAQEMNEQGLDFKLYVYDIPRNVDSTAKVLLDPRIQDMDLIISLSYSNSFALISEFSKTHHIPLVNALSKRREIIYNNPNVFKIEPKEEYLYKKTCDFIFSNYPNHNVILVRSNPYQLAKDYSAIKETLQLGMPTNIQLPHDQILYKISSYEMKYMDVLPSNFAYTATESLKKDNPEFDYDIIQAYPADSLTLRNNLKTVVYSIDSLQGLIDASSLFRDNLVVALGQNEVFAIELFTQLNFVRDSFNYEVIGLPYWNDFYSLDVAYTQPMKLKVLNSRFVDYKRPIVQKFVLNFRNEYGIEPQLRKHAFLGYDLTKYFLTALKNFGPDFVKCINEVEVELLQNDLKFEHIPETGYENINWNILMQEDYQYHKVD